MWSFPLMAGMQSGIAASVIHERSGIKHCLIGKRKKKVKKPFPTVNNVFALRRPTFTLTWICISFHWQNLYEFQRSKPFSKLHLLYLNPLSKQSFPNYSQNIRRSSLQISRSILVSQTKQVLLHSFCQRSTPSETWHKICCVLLGNSAHTYAWTPIKWGSQNYTLCPCWSRHEWEENCILRFCCDL